MILAVVLCLVGCLEDSDTATDRSVDNEIGTISAVATASAEPEDPMCRLLPDDGPCSLACDPDALLDQYVIEGTCALFLCTLTDGSQINAGGCR